MPFLHKAQGKRITTMVCLFVLFILVMVLPRAAYAAVTSVPVTLRIDQVFIKNSFALGVNSVFSYTLTSMDAANPMPAGSISGVYSFTVDGTGSKNIDPISFNNTGIYRYEIKGNTFSSAAGYSYDNEVYSLTVYVRQPANHLVTEITVQKGDGSKAGRIEFKNTYTPLASKPEIMVDPPVKKTVSGNPSKASTFTFLLKAKNEANPMPEGSANGVKTITITGSGKKDFGSWTYTREGTYYYTISEVNTRQSRYTYDTTVYTITDVVKDVNGQLDVTRTVTNGSNKQVESCIFINKYSGGSSGGSGGRGNGGSGKGSIKGVDAGVPKAGAPQTGVPEADVSETRIPKAGLSQIGIPKTGDSIRFGFYTAMFLGSFIVAACCIIYLIFTSRRKTEETVKAIGR
ncbi:MAG: hypothetical protein E7243_04360 [Lacrimispora celerecrescens]|nr:hypothetical protein [Lacrimispora celerecrescens]